MRSPFLDFPKTHRRKIIAIVFAIAAMFGIGIIQLDLSLETSAAPTGIQILQWSLSPDKADLVVESWRGRESIAFAVICLDWIYIIFYTLGFGWLHANVLMRKFLPRIGEYMFYFVPAGAMTDALENCFLMYMLYNPANWFTTVMAAIFASLKWVIIGCLFLYVFVGAIATHWRQIRHVVRLLAQVRFSIIVTVIGIAAVLLDQGQETLIAMSETQDLGIRIIRSLAILVTTGLTALVVWYSSRVMFLFPFDEERFSMETSEGDTIQFLKEHLPRLLGLSIFLLIGAAMLWASLALWPDALLILSSGVIYYLFVYYRRQIFDLPKLDKNYRCRSISELPTWTMRVLGALVIVNPFLLVLFIVAGHVIAPVMGTAAVVLLSLASIVPVGTALVYWGNKRRFPTVTVIIVWAILCSPLNDNHVVRQYPGKWSIFFPKPELVTVSHPQRNSLSSAISEWLADMDDGNADIPVVIVSTEGGGIRAAFWTGIVLGELADQVPQFPDHVFGISSVSGGSLGAAVFTSLIGNNPKNVEESPCETQGSMRCRARRVLSEDFISPTVANLVFPDMVQRFLPLPLFNDRAIALEQSWERAWDKYENGSRLTNPLLSLWQDGTARRPYMFLNSTVVEKGKRIIFQPLNLSATGFDQAFAEADDGLSIIGPEIPLSTAVHTTARFIYVSPAGTMVRYNENEKPDFMHVVDGGYFENSGALTATEILEATQHCDGCDRIFPIVIHISNDPVPTPIDPPWDRANWNGLSLIQQVGAVSDYRPPGGDRRVLMGELLSPARALLNVRPGRGYQAREALCQRVKSTGGAHVHLRLYQVDDVTLPLGWMLSQKAINEMIDQLTDENHPQIDNRNYSGDKNAMNPNFLALERIKVMLNDRSDKKRDPAPESCTVDL